MWPFHCCIFHKSTTNKKLQGLAFWLTLLQRKKCSQKVTERYFPPGNFWLEKSVFLDVRHFLERVGKQTDDDDDIQNTASS